MYFKLFLLFLLNAKPKQRISLVYLQAVVCNKKYDIEAEALNLYGEDLKAVLLRFRKSSDYYKILNERLQFLKEQVQDISMQTIVGFTKRLQLKVREILGQDENPHEGETTSLPGSPFPRCSWPKDDDDQNLKAVICEVTAIMLRIGKDIISEYFRFLRSPFNIRRQNDVRNRRNLTGVEFLETYDKLRRTLSVEQRNSMRDLGFQFAGDVIHSIIKNMGPEDDKPDSTRLPYGGDRPKQTTTTKHAHIHEVTTAAPGGHGHHVMESSTAGEVQTVPNRMRNRNTI